MERVIHFPFFFARPTTSAFYLGETRQHTTDEARRPNLKNFLLSTSEASTKASVGPSITIDSLWPGPKFSFLNFSMSLMSFLSIFLYCLQIRSSSKSSCSIVGVVKISSLMSVWISLQLFPISIAVSYLSPVRTQTFMLALMSISIVSGTPYCSLSSIAVDPIKFNSCSYSS